MKLNSALRLKHVAWASAGALVAVRGTQESPPVDIDQLPPYVPAAFVAIEDRQFYHHFGFNPWGMVRAEPTCIP